MSYFEEYCRTLIGLVDKNAPQIIDIKYNPNDRWSALTINVEPKFDPLANVKGHFLAHCMSAYVALTTDPNNRKLINKVLIQCTPESLYGECTSIIRGCYIDNSGLSSKKLKADPIYAWLENMGRIYTMDSYEPYHKEIFGIAKYIYDNRDRNNILPENHKNNVLALLQLLKRKIDNGKKTSS